MTKNQQNTFFIVNLIKVGIVTKTRRCENLPTPELWVLEASLGSFAFNGALVFENQIKP